MEQSRHSEGASSTEKPAGRPSRKKAYTPPRLIVHGTVQDITKNSGGGGSDLVLGSD